MSARHERCVIVLNSDKEPRSTMALRSSLGTLYFHSEKRAEGTVRERARGNAGATIALANDITIKMRERDREVVMMFGRAFALSLRYHCESPRLKKNGNIWISLLRHILGISSHQMLWVWSSAARVHAKLLQMDNLSADRTQSVCPRPAHIIIIKSTVRFLSSSALLLLFISCVCAMWKRKKMVTHTAHSHTDWGWAETIYNKLPFLCNVSNMFLSFLFSIFQRN